MNDLPNRDVEVFTEALQLPVDQREAYLKQACGEDETFRLKVEKLLEAHGKIGGFLDHSPHKGAIDAKSGVSVGEKPGDRIGRYKLLQQIGEGGCGVVFMAEQSEPVRRRVALKIIKPGMDTKSVIARFEAERQALALMDHPNIAKVFDAGATDSGRPYFVMELIRGVKITEYCDQHSLPIDERLKLFVQVCQAVQHAHQKGVIHRDIKPSNILVTTALQGVAMPVVIDFGIAKATANQQLTDKTLFTAFEMLIGTPAYMSPEQAALTSVDVDTRTDVYSLGVLLYELLTGLTPFDTKELVKVGLDETRRVILQEEPIRPSARLVKMTQTDLTTIALNHKSEPPKLIRAVRGDLDWIAMKAMEKDRTRRYETVNGLALDVQRFLASETISARPPSALYKLQKTVRRNKLLFAGIGLISVLFVASLIVVSASLARELQAHREAGIALQQAEAEKNKAQAEAAKSSQVTRFLEDMLQGVGPSVARGRDTTMLQEILDRTAGRVGIEMTNQPAVEAELRNLIGGLYLQIGNFDQAEKMQRAALAIDRKLHGAGSVESAASLHDLSLVLFREGNLADAEQTELEALTIRRRSYAEENSDMADSLNNLANVYTDQRRFAEAETLSREGLEIRRKLFGHQSLQVADSLHTLCVILGDEGKRAESEATARELLAIRQTLLGNEDVSVASALYDVAWAEDWNGKPNEADSLAQETLIMQRKFLGDSHPEVARTLALIGQIMGQRGQLTEADSVLSAIYSIQCKLEGDDSPDALYTLENFGSTLEAEGKLEGAEIVYRKALVAWRKRQGNEGDRPLSDLQSLVRVLEKQKQFGEARRELDEVLTPAFIKEPACVDFLWDRIDLMGRQGMWPEAITDATLLVDYQPTNHYPYLVLSALLVITHNPAAYEQLCQKCFARFGNTTQAYIAERVASDCLLLPDSSADLQQVDKLATMAVTRANDDSAIAYFEACKALSVYRLGRFSEAAGWAEKSTQNPQVFAQAKGYAVLAMAQWQLGRKDAARASLAKGNSLAPRISSPYNAVDLGGSWVAWIFARVALDEAAALIQPKPTAEINSSN